MKPVHVIDLLESRCFYTGTGRRFHLSEECTGYVRGTDEAIDKLRTLHENIWTTIGDAVAHGVEPCLRCCAGQFDPMPHTGRVPMRLKRVG